MKINIIPVKVFHKAFLFCFIMLLASCKQTQDQEEKPDRFCLSEQINEKTELHEVIVSPIKSYIRLNGKINVHPEKQITFNSLVDGVIARTHYSLGSEVSKGQTLAQVRSVALSDLQTQNSAVQQQLQVAQRQLQATQSMFDDGIASERDLLSAKSEVSILQAKLNQARSNLTLFGNSGTNGVFNIIAPNSGIVIENNITSGKQIAEGEHLFTIADLSKVWVSLNVYAGNVRHVTTNQEVIIKTLSYPDETFYGVVSQIAQVFDAEKRVMQAIVEMENKDLKLKPGMLVDVLLKENTNQEALSIPANALVFDNNKNHVIVYHDPCNLEIREVSIKTETQDYAYIKTGLKAGEKIITNNQLIIYEALNNQ